MRLRKTFLGIFFLLAANERAPCNRSHVTWMARDLKETSDKGKAAVYTQTPYDFSIDLLIIIFCHLHVNNASNILLLLCFMRRASCVVTSITRTADFAAATFAAQRWLLLLTRDFETGSTIFRGSYSTLGRATAYTLCDWHPAKIPNSRDSVPESGYIYSSIAEASRDREGSEQKKGK